MSLVRTTVCLLVVLLLVSGALAESSVEVRNGTMLTFW